MGASDFTDALIGTIATQTEAIKNLVSKVEALTITFCKVTDDHELRIRVIETWMWKMIGVSIVINLLFSAFLVLIIEYVLGRF